MVRDQNRDRCERAETTENPSRFLHQCCAASGGEGTVTISWLGLVEMAEQFPKGPGSLVALARSILGAPKIWQRLFE